MSAARVLWFRARLLVAFPLVCVAALIIDYEHFGDMARCLHDLWENGEP